MNSKKAVKILCICAIPFLILCAVPFVPDFWATFCAIPYCEYFFAVIFYFAMSVPLDHFFDWLSTKKEHVFPKKGA